jgi:mxaJ protein
MSSRSLVDRRAYVHRWTTRFVISLACISVLEPVHATPLTICAEPDNLPFSSRQERGFEIEAATILATELGRPLEVHWVAQRLPDFLRVTIGAGICEALMSVPRESHKLATTAPWYRTSFVFVSKAMPAFKNFDDPRLHSLSIAVPMVSNGGGTPPAIALMQRGLLDQIRPYSALESARMVRAVGDGKVDLAVVWGPFAGWYAANGGVPLTLSPTPDRDGNTPMAFDMSIGVGRDNEDLRRRLDAVLVHRRVELGQVLARWHVPLSREPGE